MNVNFEYLYRDAGNYKNWGGVIFSNPKGENIDAIKACIQKTLRSEFFDVTAVRLPDLHFPEFNPALDLPLHEFYDVNCTEQAPNDIYDRSINQFVDEFVKVNSDGS